MPSAHLAPAAAVKSSDWSTELLLCGPSGGDGSGDGGGGGGSDRPAAGRAALDCTDGGGGGGGVTLPGMQCTQPCRPGARGWRAVPWLQRGAALSPLSCGLLRPPRCRPHSRPPLHLNPPARLDLHPPGELLSLNISTAARRVSLTPALRRPWVDGVRVEVNRQVTSRRCIFYNEGRAAAR